jgi:hypothetical protein
MLTIAKDSRIGSRVLAAIVVLITSVVLVNATTSLTVPNAATYPWTLPPGGSFNVGVPALDRPVFLMGVCTTVGDRGIGQVSILRATAAPGFLMWTGLESATPSGVTSGFSATPGTHIVYFDFAHTIDVQVLTATAFRVHNTGTSLKTGAITMIW